MSGDRPTGPGSALAAQGEARPRSAKGVTARTARVFTPRRRGPDLYRNGNGLPASAGSACAVTSVGVTA